MRGHWLELGTFVAAAVLSSTLQLGCGECVWLQCEPRAVPLGTHRLVEGQEVSWALEVSEVEITDDGVTVHYTGLDRQEAVAEWGGVRDL